MTDSELQQCLELLRTAGFSPMLCDTPVPLVDIPVLAGYPAEAGDSTEQNYIMLPRELVGSHPTFLINARGDSMRDIGIGDGDTLEVQIGDGACDGDVVVAEVDGSFTVKTFYTDSDGLKWLVPENDDFEAIRLMGRRWRIIGRVTGLRKGIPRSAYTHCAKSVMRAMRMDEARDDSSTATAAAMRQGPCNLVFRQFYKRRAVDFGAIRKAIERVIVKQMKYRYEWFAAYRVMMDIGLLEELQLSKFALQMQEWFPDVPIRCTADSLGEYAVGHTSCAFSLWDSTRFRAEKRKGQSTAGFTTLFHRCEELRAALFPVPVVDMAMPF